MTSISYNVTFSRYVSILYVSEVVLFKAITLCLESTKSESFVLNSILTISKNGKT